MNETTSVHERLDALEASIAADRDLLHRKIDGLLKGLHHLITTGSIDMSKVTDLLRSGATTLAGLATDNAAKTTTLIGFKDENDSALNDIVATIGTASDALKATGADLDKAIAAHDAAPPTDSGQTGAGPIPPASATEAPAAIDPTTGLPVSG